MFQNVRSLILISCLLVSFNSHAGLIFQEDFSGGSPSLIGWSDNDATPTSFEIYGAGAATPHGVSSTYDHDNNPLTPEITIPAGLEVNDQTSQVTLTSANFSLTETLTSNNFGRLTYFAGVRRNNSLGAFVEVFNVTQNFSLTGEITDIVFNSGTWTYNSFDFLWGSSVTGDQLQIRWYGGGDTSANGQQIADVKLFNELNSNVINANAPSSFGILVLGILLFLFKNTIRRTFK